MKKIILLLTAFYAQQIVAQDVSKIGVPTTPAFSILEYEPSSVMRPTSTKKLSADVLNSFDKNGKLLMNLGLEVAPYWLRSRKISREEYLNPEPFQSLKQTFKISGATVKDTITGNNNFGLGVKFLLFQGKVSNDFKQQEEKLFKYESIVSIIEGFKSTSKIKNIDTIIFKLNNALKECEDPVLSKADIEEFETTAFELSKKANNSKEGIKTFYTELLTYYNEERSTKLAKEVIKLNNKRTGFSLEFAAASKFVTTNSNDPFRKVGIWINANNYVSTQDALTITTRWLFANNDTAISNMDIGLAYLREEKEFNISVEGMARWYKAEIPDKNIAGIPIKKVEKNFTYRLAAQASYKMNKDLSLNLSFGKNFGSPFITGTGFFSILGFNYTIFNVSPKDIDTKK